MFYSSLVIVGGCSNLHTEVQNHCVAGVQELRMYVSVSALRTWGHIPAVK